MNSLPARADASTAQKRMTAFPILNHRAATATGARDNPLATNRRFGEIPRPRAMPAFLPDATPRSRFATVALRREPPSLRLIWTTTEPVVL